VHHVQPIVAGCAGLANVETGSQPHLADPTQTSPKWRRKTLPTRWMQPGSV
jgi:hypothetical protein